MSKTMSVLLHLSVSACTCGMMVSLAYSSKVVDERDRTCVPQNFHSETSSLWMVFLKGQHISQMNGKPTCIVEIVVG